MSWLKNMSHSSSSRSNIQQQPSHSATSLGNSILFQTFEWHTPSQPPAPNETHKSTSHFARLNRILPSLAQAGITAIWLPPGCKANDPSGNGNGYDCYDIWDLGEFDQKYARSTKWGSREELRDLINAARREGVECIWDAVLNHKTAGDATDEAWAVEVDKEDRRIEICPPKKIEAWLKYDFPGRGTKYSRFKWRAEHFNGTDWDQRAQKNAIFKLVDDPATYPKPFQQQQTSMLSSGSMGLNRLARLAGKVTGAPARRPGKGWAEDVDNLHGNYDYLMFSNVDYRHPAVREDVLNWGKWMVQDVGIDGFRMDAVQHFSYNFTKDWIAQVNDASRRQRNGKDAFIVGEIWTGEVERIHNWLDVVGQGAYAYDSPLLYNFSRISEDVRTGSKNADLRTIFRDSLLETRPQNAVTFVTNHDTQPGQTSFAPMLPELKPLWYAFILLWQAGYPTIFWGDLYGTKGPKAEPPACGIPDGKGGMRSLIPDLMLARRLFAYGEQTEYLDAMSCIGWTRAGTADRPGCAVVVSIGSREEYTVKEMAIGRPGEVFVDVLANEGQRAEVKIDESGKGVFPCKGMGVGVFVLEGADGVGRFPVSFDTNVYAL